MVRVLGFGFCVRVSVRVSITGSVNYLNKKFVVGLALLLFLAGGDHCV